MADTRCANSGLQLDVDLMILDYLLYQTISAYFDYLSDDSREKDKSDKVGRHHILFHTFVHQFKLNHPSHRQDAEMSFKLDILEFLVLLFNQASTALEFSDETRERFGTQTAANIDLRRTWLAAHERHIRRLRQQQPDFPDNELSRDLEEALCSAWCPQDSSMATTSSEHSRGPLLFDLLERFMSISANTMDVIEQDISSMWVEFACHFMLQASLESLQLRLQGGGEPESLPRLEDCFAWGYIDLDVLTEDEDHYSALIDDGKVDLVNNLFRASASADGKNCNRENPMWTRFRSGYLQEFSISLSAATELSQTCRLERLAAKYPVHIFLDRLVTVLQHMWASICQDGAMGKPVLVEIEEGHLKSLDIEGPAFQDFMARVGLTDHDINGCLKLKL